MAFGLALGRAWCEPSPAAEEGASPARMESLPAAVDSQGTVAHSGSFAAAYREHAPLAWFSLGSLAVGGVFYAIGHDMQGPRVGYSAADRARLSTAISVAGIGAVLAAGSYFYYVHQAKARAENDPEWDAAVTGAPDGAGGFALGARLTLALSSLR